MGDAAAIRCLTFATDVDVLPLEPRVGERPGRLVVRTPDDPAHYWGNFLLFPYAPGAGDRERWEDAFDEDIAGRQPGTRHRAFEWDVADGELGAAEAEFVHAGYELERTVGLVATPQQLLLHPRASRDVRVRSLDPSPGVDEAAWAAVVDLHVSERGPGHGERTFREFAERGMAARRARFVAGHGAWFVAETPGGEVAASCGVFVVAGRARYQDVHTAPAYRRQGVATRLVHDAGRSAVERYGARHLVIAAELEYHALPLYESLGFQPRERVSGVCWWPGAPNAACHPVLGHLAQHED